MSPQDWWIWCVLAGHDPRRMSTRPRGLLHMDDREFDEMRTEQRHQAELIHRDHADVTPDLARIEAGYNVGCGICFEDYVDLVFDGPA